MKSILLVILVGFYIPIATANEKTVTINVGELSDSVRAGYSTITTLTVNGSIDARDFKTIRDSMEALTSLDLSNAVIEAYNGYYGTSYADSSVSYPVNTLPEGALYFKRELNSLVLPEGIIALDNHSIDHCSGLSSLIIPSTVSTLGDGALARLYSLDSLILPNSLTSIGEGCFWLCIELTSITNSDSLTSIGERAFESCEKLTSIAIHALVNNIGYMAFSNCGAEINVNAGNPNYSSHEGVLYNKEKTELIICPISKTGNYIIPSSVISLEDYAFLNCTNLDSTTIPASLTNHGNGSFRYTTAKISVDAANTNYSSQDGVLFNKDKTTLITCPISISEYIIPNSVTNIESSAFYNSRELTTVTIPSSVTSIGESAFAHCQKILSVYVNWPAPSEINIQSYAFSGTQIGSTLYVPEGTKSAYEATGLFNAFSNIIEMSTSAVNDIFSYSKLIEIYPNPAHDRLFIKNIEDSNSVIVIFDSHGKIVISKQLDNNYIDISNLENGMYFIKAMNSNNTYIQKLIKK